MTPKILAFSGSARSESYNHRALDHAVAGARTAGAEVTLIRLRDFSLPIYDGDLEAQAGLPAGALELKELFKAHQGLLIASPEYNSSFSALLKNTLDWVSRAHAGESGLAPYRNKVAVLVAASPGALGGARGLRQLREILAVLGVLVLPRQYTIPHADQDLEAGRESPRHVDALLGVGAELAQACRKWNRA